MPRDATDTRARLLSETERLFATRGIHQTTTREITDAAGQRNSSAVTYHFGSRSGILRAILLRHGTPLDDERAALASEPLETMATRAMVAALVLPYAGCLATPSGRNYLRIVAQLSDHFALWRTEQDLNPPNLRRILATLERRVTDPALGRERVTAAIMLLTASLAERARLIDDGGSTTLDEEAFVSNLADMIVGMLEAPVGTPLPPPGASKKWRRARSARPQLNSA